MTPSERSRFLARWGIGTAVVASVTLVILQQSLPWSLLVGVLVGAAYASVVTYLERR